MPNSLEENHHSPIDDPASSTARASSEDTCPTLATLCSEEGGIVTIYRPSEAGKNQCAEDISQGAQGTPRWGARVTDDCDWSLIQTDTARSRVMLPVRVVATSANSIDKWCLTFQPWEGIFGDVSIKAHHLDRANGDDLITKDEIQLSFEASEYRVSDIFVKKLEKLTTEIPNDASARTVTTILDKVLRACRKTDGSHITEFFECVKRALDENAERGPFGTDV